MGKKKKQKTKIVYRDREVYDVTSLPPQRPTGAQNVNDVGGFLSGLRDVMQQASEGKANGKVLPPPPTADGTDPLDPEVAKASVNRLVTLFKTLGEKPEPILSMFSRLGIPWELIENVPGDPMHDIIVIWVADLEAGDQRNQEQGSIAQRVYGDRIGAAMSPYSSRTDPEAGVEAHPENEVVTEKRTEPTESSGKEFEHDFVQLQCDNGTPPDLSENDSEDYVIEDDPYDPRKVQG